MNIDTSFATEVTSSERMDLSDIVELQLRRGEIELRTYIVNTPDLNVALVELSIDTSLKKILPGISILFSRFGNM